MRVIFLDIDGVLNSAAYDREKKEWDGNIDVSRLPLLRRIVTEGEAVIVLSTTWRHYWDSDPAQLGDIGIALEAVFRDAGLTVFDKTPTIDGRVDTVRPHEIRAWLREHTDTESFVILDDIFFGWGDLQDSLVHTSYYKGRGLEEDHAEKAVKILKKTVNG